MAAGRLMLLVQEERGRADEQMMQGIRDDILAVLERHTRIPAAHMTVNLGRDGSGNRIEIGMELPKGRRTPPRTECSRDSE